MITLKKLVDRIEQWCIQNPFLGPGHFDHGEFPDDIDQYKDSQFPLVFLVPRDATFQNGMISFPFDFVVMDQTEEENAQNRTDIRASVLQIQSDTFQLITEFITEASNPDFIENEVPVEIELPVSAVPFEEKYKGVLTGWNANITFQVATQGCG